MKDCFEVRYNLEKMTNECATDVPGALSSLFGNKKQDVAESIEYYNAKADANASALKEKLGGAAEAFADKKIAFFGDSITSDRLSYANLVIRSGIFAVACEFAISGITSTIMAQKMCACATNADYDYICVYIGTNDEYRTEDGETMVSVSEYERNLRRSAEIIKKDGAKGVFFRICDRPDTLGMTNPAPFNDAAERVAGEYGFTVIDTHKINPTFIEDRIHLDEKTQLDLAELFLKTLINQEK